jgi:deazaflavin-dependent oxidoreductase (nitroreductase family)
MPPLMRRIFWFINKLFMVPLFRLGFGPFFVNPLTGYIMVLKVIGRKTGKTRYTPVNYTIYKGDIYCVSGGRQTSDWYRNLLANPEVEIILPSGPVYAHVEETPDPKCAVWSSARFCRTPVLRGFSKAIIRSPSLTMS